MGGYENGGGGGGGSGGREDLGLKINCRPECAIDSPGVAPFARERLWYLEIECNPGERLTYLAKFVNKGDCRWLSDVLAKAANVEIFHASFKVPHWYRAPLGKSDFFLFFLL